MLSKTNQTQKEMYCMIPFMGNIQNRQILRDRNQIRDCRGWDRGEWGVDCFIGTVIPFEVMKFFSELDSGDGCTA